jgi:tetratricopeptide (TPR) repeat protein
MTFRSFKNLAFLALFIFQSIQKAQSQTIADGLRYLDNEQFINAGRIFRSLAATQPTAPNLYYLGHFYLNLERRDSVNGLYADSAKMVFQKGVQADPKFNLNYIGLGTYEISKGQFATGKLLIDKGVTASKGKDAELLYRAAEAYVYYHNNDALEANRLLDMAIKINPKNPDYFNLKGDAFMLKNEGSPAANNYDQAKRIAPNSAKAYINYGNILIRAKSYQKALESYLEGMAKDSLYAPGYRQLGELYYKAGKFENAVASYRKYINMTDSRPENQYRFGAFLFLSKAYDEAISVLTNLPENYKNDFRYRLLGYCQAEKQMAAEGFANMEIFMTKVDSSKHLASDYYYYGKLLIESGKDTAKGVVFMTKAADKDSSRMASLVEYGKKCFDAKRYLRAAEAYAVVLERGKKTNQDYFNLGNAYFFGKDYVKADTVYSQLLRIQPKSILANLFKARCINFQKLDQDQSKGLAKPYYETFTLLVTPENQEKYKKQAVEAYSYLGGYYAIRKDVPQAHAAWKKVLEIEPDNKKAKDGLLIK